ncbi:MAG: hypothetical protein ACJ71O_00995, partial [Nitrososphaeraceae archaeon]
TIYIRLSKSERTELSVELQRLLKSVENATELGHRYLNKSLAILLVIWVLYHIGYLGLEAQFQEVSHDDIY